MSDADRYEDLEPPPVAVWCLGCGGIFDLGNDLFDHWNEEETR